MDEVEFLDKPDEEDVDAFNKKERKLRAAAKKLIGTPDNFQHKMHLGENEFGLTPEMESVLKNSKMSQKEINENKEVISQIINANSDILGNINIPLRKRTQIVYPHQIGVSIHPTAPTSYSHRVPARGDIRGGIDSKRTPNPPPPLVLEQPVPPSSKAKVGSNAPQPKTNAHPTQPPAKASKGTVQNAPTQTSTLEKQQAPNKKSGPSPHQSLKIQIAELRASMPEMDGWLSDKDMDPQTLWDRYIHTDRDVDILYPVRKKVGGGASGTVFVTINPDKAAVFPHHLLALKHIVLTETTDYVSLINEVFLQHVSSSFPNVVRFHDAFYMESSKTFDEKQLWIVMDYMGGGSVTNLLTVNGVLREESIIAYIIREMLKALNFMHKKNMIHRDLKSDNVLLGMDGSCKLADFGFCAQLTVETQTRKSIVGTPYWMAPELIQGLEYDQMADIWSLGITALECADGEPPLMNLPLFRALFLIVVSPAPTLKNPQDFSPEFNHFLTCCLQHDVSKRWTAEKLLEHPFIKKAANAKDLIPLINKTRLAMNVDDSF